MGDVAMTVPVLRILLHTYPNLQVTLLTRQLFAPFFEGIDRLHIHIADVNGLHKGIFGLRRLTQELQRSKIHAIADLHDVLRSKVLRFFLPNTSRTAVINKGRKEKEALTRQRNKVKKQLKSTHQRYADVFENLGFPIDLEIDLPYAKRSISSATQQLLERLCPSIDQYSTWIGIAPFAKHKGKMYPIDLMEEVIEELTQFGLMIFLFGGKEDYDILQSIDNQYSNVINVSTKISLVEELNLIHQLKLMISMDSANMHMASLVDTRVLSIWGATHPFAGFMGWKQRMEDAILPDALMYPDLPSSIYGNKLYPEYEDCMRSIAPEDIVKRTHIILSKSHS